MTEIINRVIPIVVLLGVGSWMRQTRFLAETTVADLRKLVVNVALPSVLFISFLGIDFARRDLLIVLITFTLPIGFYFAGKLLAPHFGANHDYFAVLMTGFEAGMLGIGLFGTAYGIDRVAQFVVVDLGHELFIWFVFLALLLGRRDGNQDRRGLATAFFKSPAIVAILAGLGANLIGMERSLEEWPITGGLLAALALLATLTAPMILLIVGYGIHLDMGGLMQAVAPVAVRLCLTLPVAVALPLLLEGNVLGGNVFSQAALFTLLILPPPFIIPLYMRDDADDERRYVNNVLSLYTIVSIVVFVVYLAVNPL